MELCEVNEIRFVEVAPPTLSPEQLSRQDKAWRDAVDANPRLFDGPVVACIDFTIDDDNTATVRWTRATYRSFAGQRVAGIQALRGLFVAVVLITDRGRLVTGRTSSASALPGRLQIPGGSMEPPRGSAQEIDEASCARHAVRELAEEVGIALKVEDVKIWGLIQGDHGNVGVLFRAPPVAESLVRKEFDNVLIAENTSGREPEFDQIHLLEPGNLKCPIAPAADHVNLLLTLPPSQWKSPATR